MCRLHHARRHRPRSTVPAPARRGCGRLRNTRQWAWGDPVASRHSFFSESRRYTHLMARTHEKVRFLPKGKQKHTAASAAKGVEDVLRILEGRWKLAILFHLFGGNVRRFSELRRAMPAVSEKMLIQQLRHMERDGIVRRFVHHQVPPKVEYSLTDWGQALCPALNALLTWVELRPSTEAAPVRPTRGIPMPATDRAS